MRERPTTYRESGLSIYRAQCAVNTRRASRFTFLTKHGSPPRYSAAKPTAANETAAHWAAVHVYATKSLAQSLFGYAAATASCHPTLCRAGERAGGIGPRLFLGDEFVTLGRFTA